MILRLDLHSSVSLSVVLIVYMCFLCFSGK